MGITSHSGVKQCMESALKTNWYDCLMPSYSIDKHKEFKDIFAKCKQQNVGFVAMKSGISEKNPNLVSALLKEKNLTTICKSLKNLNATKNYIDSSYQKISETEAEKIMKLSAIMSVGRCRMCGSCTGACGKGLPVSDIVRCMDYYINTENDYETAKATYESLEKRADLCVDCGNCEAICPNRVPIRNFMRVSREMFV